MSTQFKYRLLLGFSVLCLAGLAAQSVYLWQLNQRLTAAGIDPLPAVSSLEEKILANAANSSRAAPLAGNLTPFGMNQPAWPDPFASMQQFQQQMDSLFGAFGFGTFGNSSNSSNFGSFGSFGGPSGFGSLQFSSATPQIEVSETATEYQVVIPVSPDQEIDLNTSIEDNTLSVAGTIKTELSDLNNHFATSVQSQSQFARTINLPEPVDELGLSTRQTDAGIIISIPKKTA